MSVNTPFPLIMNGSLNWASPHSGLVLHTFHGKLEDSSFSWALFAIHRLAKGSQPGPEGGSGAVIGSPFVDLEGSLDS